MKNTQTPLQTYLDQLPEDRKEGVTKLRQVISAHLPAGFTEIFNNGISFVVPHSLYPEGYHCQPTNPLPFISIASQKNVIALYHMGMYANPQLSTWFTVEYPKHSSAKLGMGKSCIRFKKPEHIPYELIGTLCSKMTTNDWITLYEASFKHKKQ